MEHERACKLVMWFTALNTNESKQTDSSSAVARGAAGEPPAAIRDPISGA